MRILLVVFALFSAGVSGQTPRERVFNTFLKNGIDSLTAKILVAQASFESGGFSNPLTLQSNNVFALMHNPYRKTLSLNGKGFAEKRYGYAQYKSIEDATLDFIWFLEYRNLPKKLTGIGYYATLLKQKRYYGKDPKKQTTDQWWAEVKIYAAGVRRHYKQLFHMKHNPL